MMNGFLARRGAVVCGVCVVLASLAAGSSALASPTINGIIDPATEGWLLLTEAGYAEPVPGGSTTTSDQVGESCTFHWWEGVSEVDVEAADNRGDIINIYLTQDSDNLYLAVAGPTAPFNDWWEENELARNDIGDLYIALDVDGGAASGHIRADEGHTVYGTKAVDFLGWAPTHVVGVQFVDNGGGGGGGADIETTVTHQEIAGEGQNQNDGGFDWHATIRSGPDAPYDTVNLNAGEFEFAIPWSLLGLPQGGPPTGQPLRIAAYITQNFEQSDVYDSGPGVGNQTVYEELGDCPGDPDDSGQLGACDPGSYAGSQPGANFVADINFDPGHGDGIDTIEEYMSWEPRPAPSIPAFSEWGLIATAVLLIAAGTILFRGRQPAATHRWVEEP
ncbi:MAG: hypothetical protein JXQ75_21730 [Phycisphaerae bacterium]|nr:hypothetical protein [Phycisphaerae bacterium]